MRWVAEVVAMGMAVGIAKGDVMDAELRRAYEFFHEHAGWSTPPGRAACALQMARDERWGREREVEVRWECDEDYRDDDSDWCKHCLHLESCPKRFRSIRDGCPHLQYHEPHTAEYCVVRLDGETESLFGITDASTRYRRVVEAELVGELRHRVEGVEKLMAESWAL